MAILAAPKSPAHQSALAPHFLLILLKEAEPKLMVERKTDVRAHPVWLKGGTLCGVKLLMDKTGYRLTSTASAWRRRFRPVFHRIRNMQTWCWFLVPL